MYFYIHMAILREGKSDEELKIQEKWFEVRSIVKEKFNKSPDINAILFLIGVNELGFVDEKWTKVEKRDIIHIAICVLFEEYHQFENMDKDGWPHYKEIKILPDIFLSVNERNLKLRIIEYLVEKGYLSFKSL